jgi:dihydropteroate synthase
MRLMGILNVTPDSFSDGGRFVDVAPAVEQGLRLFDEGAHVVDVGGESTRPGATAVSPEDELARVLPVVTALARRGPVSVDTRRASVAKAAIEAGATLVNDVSGGADPAMFATCAHAGVGLVLMHMRGEPATMQSLAAYDEVCAEVWGWLDARAREARLAGVHDVIVDPGLGFAKTAAHNLALLRDLPARTADRTVLIGASRKAFLGALTGQANPAERLEGSLAVALHCADAGAAWIRVHDVAATARALAVWEALRS